MKKITCKIFTNICFGILWITSLLPLWVHYIISDAMYLFVYYILRYRRCVVRQNLVSAFPEKSIKEIEQIERDFFHWFCDYIVETFKLMSVSKEEIRRRIVFKGTEIMEQLTREGVSCGVMLGHYCNWEWISALPLTITDTTICALYHPIENPDVNRLYLWIRQRLGNVCIPMEKALREIVNYKNSGQPIIVGYIADQKPNWRNIHLWIDFLNHNTPVFTGSERIIKHTRQAFFYGDMHRIKRGYYECEFKLLERNSETIPDYKLSERYMQELEKSIRREPALWLWSHDRWSRTKEEFDKRFYVKDGKVYEKVTESEYAEQMGWRNYWHH